MRYAIVKSGTSRSFPEGSPFHNGASDIKDAEVVIYCGAVYRPDASKAAILIELGDESLAEHIGEDGSAGESNVLGFSRYRNGNDAPSDLVELVRGPQSNAAAIAAAKQMFEAAGLETVTSADQIGRIINRLVVPKYNAALRFLDEGLATQADMDLTCKLGLGYPDGPIERVRRGGLESHYKVSKSLFDAYGTPSFAPARSAVVAFNRARRSEKG